ncbi:class II fructose-bisphosphate aldolase [bacterium]|nr:class II fructose-bisphosphate aldolase [bacterium]
MLQPFPELLGAARAGGYAVGYFEPWDVYSLEAVVEAAEAEQTPVILGIGGVMMERAWFDGGGLERLGALGLVAARRARVPTTLLLNEVATHAQVVRGIQSGFNAVMLDTSDLPYAENVRRTRQVVETAHAAGVSVEGEIGTLPDASGELGGGAGQLTDPNEAARFVRDTGVDALAVSIGNVHTLLAGRVTVNLEHLAAIQRAVTLPLVIHGGSGFPEESIPAAVRLGVTKFNFGTVLKGAFLAGIQDAIAALPPQVNVLQAMGSRKEADVLQQGKLRMRREVVRLIRWLKPGTTASVEEPAR